MRTIAAYALLKISTVDLTQDVSKLYVFQIFHLKYNVLKGIADRNATLRTSLLRRVGLLPVTYDIVQ